MNMFQIYMLFFGISTVIGVPLLSSFQVTQIKGSTWGDWVSGLGASLGPAAGICVVITIITYIIMKPLLNLIKKAETEAITPENNGQPLHFEVDSEQIEDGENILEIQSPLWSASVSNPVDDRQLGIAIQSVRFSPAT